MGPVRQFGVALLDVLIASALGAVFAIGMIHAALANARQRTLDQALESAQAIAQLADANQQRVTATTQDPATGVYKYTFGGRRTAYTPATTLEAEMGKDVPDLTPWGTSYEFRANGYPAQVRFTIPAANAVRISLPTSVASSTDSNGVVTVTVDALRLPSATHSRKLAYVKSAFYHESTR